MTALKAHEVERFLQKPDLPAGVYLVYGTDAGLVREIGQRLSKHFAGENPDPMAHTVLQGDELTGETGRLVDEARTPSLFGGSRTVRVRNATKALTVPVSLLLDDMPDAVVVLEAGNLPKSDALRALAEKHKLARALPCYADNDRAINDLILNSFRQDGIQADNDAIATLRTLLGNDREVTRRELEKLCLYAAQSKQITADDVERLCGDNSARAIDAILDAVGSGNARQFDEAFEGAATSGIDPQRVLSAALQHFAGLRRLRLLVDAGQSPKDAVSAARPRVHFSRTSAMERQVRLWSDDALANAIGRFYDAIHETRRNSAVKQATTARALLAVCVAAAQR